MDIRAKPELAPAARQVARDPVNAYVSLYFLPHMHQRNRSTCALLALATILFGSCSDRTSTEPDFLPSEVRAYARARCDKMLSCECSATGYSSQEECEDRIASIYTRSIEPLVDVDLGCFLDAADAWTTSQCDWPAGIEACEATSRSDNVGARCDRNMFSGAYLHTSTCSFGLTCADGFCVETPTDKDAGDACSQGGLCGSELTCIADACAPYSASGEACEVSLNCAPLHGLYCSADTCIERKENGGACTDSDMCKLGAPCIENRCTPIQPVICIMADF